MEIIVDIFSWLDEYEDKVLAKINISGEIFDSEIACLADSTDISNNDFDQ